ncbi:MAG: GAF domain-containing SpoIIE family protein phosphatase [Gaiellales bacterium]
MSATADPSGVGIEWLRERLQHLQTLSAALAAARTEQQAIEATLNPGLDVFQADQAVIATLDERAGVFRIVAALGYPSRIENDWAVFPNTDGYPLSEAVRRQEPVIVHGPDELVRRYPKLAGTARSAALVCLPMGEVGGIALGYDRDVTLSTSEVEFMTAVARQCAEAVQRTALDAERGRRAQRLALLAEAGAVFARTLDYRATLAEVANLAVPRLADCCIVDVLEPTGLHQLAAVHVEPERVPQIARLEQAYPADADDEHSAVGEVLRTGTPTLVPILSDEILDRLTRNEDHRAAVERLGMRSLIIVPLVARGRTLGAITLILDISERRYDEQDLATAQGLADRAALAIDNARLYRAQIEIATTLQRSLLPERLPEIPGVDVGARYMPASQAVEVGGDFYDVWVMDDGSFGAAIGDVSGKGAPAASMTALARHTLRVASLHEPTPSRVLGVLNSEMLRHGDQAMFCTTAYAHAQPAPDGGLDLRLSRGGHPPGIVRRATGEIEEVGSIGTLLGVRDEVTLTDDPIHLAPGDALVLYTDGVTERRDGTGMLGEEGLAAAVAAAPPASSAEEMCAVIEQTIHAFSADPPQDDVAIVVIRPV